MKDGTKTLPEIETFVKVTRSATARSTVDVDQTVTTTLPLKEFTTGSPKIIGDTFGTTLRVDPGTWPADTTFTYQWKVDGSEQFGETASTFRADNALEVGKKITVDVTASKRSYASRTVTSSSVTLKPASLTGSTPTISGTAKEGEILRADPGTWSDGVQLGYTWYADGVRQEGVVTDWFELGHSHVGKKITVSANGYKDGYALLSYTSAATAAVEAKPVDPRPTGPGETAPDKTLDTSVPRIVGIGDQWTTPKINQILTADAGSWTPGTTLSYQWFADGRPVSGATDKTFTITDDQLYSTIYVRVTGSLDGYATAYRESGKTPSVPWFQAPAPSIEGSARIFSTLTADPGNWEEGTALSYQWKSNGTAISDATSQTLPLTSTLKGTTISVEVSGKKSGFLDTRYESADTAKVGLGLLTAPTPTISGTAQVNKTLTVSTGAWTTGTTLSYQWNKDGKAIEGATGTTLALTPALVKSRITVTVSGAKSDYESTSKVSAQTAAVAAAPLQTSTPTLSGSAVSGEKLTANLGTWTPGTSFTYQWKADGQILVGQTGASLVLTPAMIDKQITLKVTGSLAGYTTETISSEPSSKIAPATLRTSVPTISGTARVDSTLTADAGTWTAGADLAYQWKVDGTPVKGATSKTFTPTAAQQGQRVSVTVKGSLAGYTSAETTSVATAPVALGVLKSAPVAISGTAAVGSKLTASTGSWATGTKLSYQWSADGSSIASATGSSLEIAPELEGKRITVTVSGSLTGYASASVSSAATAAVAQAVLQSATPTISGTAQVEKTLTVSTGTWTKGAKLSYQWKADGSEISGATGTSLVLAPELEGKQITVVVSGSLAGYTSVVKESAKTSAVAAKVKELQTSVPSISGTTRVGSTLSAKAGTWTSGAKLSYQWYANGSTLSGQTGTTLALTSSLKDKAITVKVTGSLSGYTSASSTSRASAKVAAGLLSTSAPSISGTTRVGQKLTAKTGTWTKGTKLSYQWKAGGASIKGATGSTLTLASSLRGKKITVTTTGQLSGYTTASRTSSASSAISYGVLTAPTPGISGTTRVGHKLTVKAGTWTKGTKLSYQWYASGKAIKGATKSTYTPTSSYAGKSISVKVKGSLSGYSTVTKTSKSTARIAKPYTLKTSTPKISGTTRVGSKLTAKAGSWTSGTSLKYQWYANGRAISKATKSTLVLTSSTQNKRITVKVTGSKSGYKTVSKTSKSTAKIAGLRTLKSTTPKISGTARVGKRLSVKVGTWTSGTKRSYQWYASGKAIKGATKSTLVLSNSQKGRTITVKVTGSKSGYKTVSKTSGKTSVVRAK
jgi:hypothetical protein